MNNYKVWTLKDGRQVKIEQMTSSHIENCIRALKENRINKIIDLKALEEIGWGLDDDYIEDIEMEDTEWKSNWINAFKEELKRRGVKI
jgi:hypothetical protein